jgi:hypothetical protein
LVVGIAGVIVGSRVIFPPCVNTAIQENGGDQAAADMQKSVLFTPR